MFVTALIDARYDGAWLEHSDIERSRAAVEWTSELAERRTPGPRESLPRPTADPLLSANGVDQPSRTDRFSCEPVALRNPLQSFAVFRFTRGDGHVQPAEL